MQLNMSTIWHPQMDGVSEIIKDMVETTWNSTSSTIKTIAGFLPPVEVVYNVIVDEDICFSVFNQCFGWNPNNSLDFIFWHRSFSADLGKFKKDQNTSLEGAQFSYKISKLIRHLILQRQFNHICIYIFIYIDGCTVWINISLFKHVFSLPQKSDKLSKCLGPFEETCLMVENAVSLGLPDLSRFVQLFMCHKKSPFS